MREQHVDAKGAFEWDRRWVPIQLGALAVTLGLVARAVVGGFGALVVAGMVFVVAMGGWTAVKTLDGRRRRGRPSRGRRP
jgi:hypothetical protein